jgi:DNA-binding response OmpR family regulator
MNVWSSRSARQRLQLDPAHRAAIGAGGNETKLTNLEFRLLHLLMSRPGFVFKTEDIIQTVWGARRQGDAALLKNMVYRLRKKLEEESGEARLIQTWPGGDSFLED